MEKKQLQKNLGAAAALSTVVGMVIGGGVFFKPQAVYEITGGGPGLGMIAWVLAGIMTITAGLTAAEVSAAIPKTGGMMVYIEEIYGKKLGFLTGWMQSVLFFPATIAALAVMFGQQSAGLLGNESLSMPIALGIILLISVLNNISSKAGGMIQTVSTVGKLLPLILIMIFGFIKGEGNNPIVQPMVAEGVNPMSIIGQLLIAVLFAYDGWINVGAIAGEMKDPGKDLPKAIIIFSYGSIRSYKLSLPLGITS
jgi:APA family basic amino acid/polyamine antiporter